MASKTETYVAARDFTIEQTAFVAGDIIGSGNFAEREFTPAANCPHVELGHVEPRLLDGRITVGKEPAKKTGK